MGCKSSKPKRQKTKKSWVFVLDKQKWRSHSIDEEDVS
jgi:hypothetical protein